MTTPFAVVGAAATVVVDVGGIVEAEQAASALAVSSAVADFKAIRLKNKTWLLSWDLVQATIAIMASGDVRVVNAP